MYLKVESDCLVREMRANVDECAIARHRENSVRLGRAVDRYVINAVGTCRYFRLEFILERMEEEAIRAASRYNLRRTKTQNTQK